MGQSGESGNYVLKMRATAVMPVKHGDNTFHVCLGRGGDINEFTTDQGITLVWKVTNAAHFEVTGDVIFPRQIDGRRVYCLFLFETGGVRVLNPGADAAGGNIHQFTLDQVLER